MEPLVSVIVPVFNCEEYIDRCIESLITQSYRNLEIIIINDGSTDNSASKCDAWSLKDERIIIVHKKNGGLSDARNVGIDTASGEYISFVDGDDSVHPDIYELFVQKAINYNGDIVCCGKNKIYSDHVRKTQTIKRIRIYSNIEAINELFYGKEIDESSCDKFFKRHLFNDTRFPVNEINEDLATIPYVFYKSNKIIHLGLPLYNYYQNNGSITRSGYSTKLSIVLKHLHDLEYFVSSKQLKVSTSYNVLLARYSVAMLIRIAADRYDSKTSHIDYSEYKKMLCLSFLNFILTRKNTMKDKLIGLMVYLGLENVLIYMKRKRKNTKLVK